MADVEQLQTRAAATRNSLMRAMEKLCAQQGVENITVKAVIAEAGQRNESAMQYHFKNKEGLVTAIHRSRFEQTDSKRRELLTEFFDKSTSPTVSDLCYLLIAPTFQLCRSDAGYRQWVEAFGVRTATVRQPLREKDILEGNGSIRIILNHLKESLAHLDAQMFEVRHLMVLRLIALSMSNHAKEEGAFAGASADFFFSNLVDVVAEIFSAAVSRNTREFAERAKSDKSK